MTDAPTGVLLVNVGTPDAPRAREVRRYLREFLGDRRVLDVSPLGRWLLLNLVILPLRPRRSAEAYRAIWTEEGSPLLVHTRAFAAALQDALGPAWPVEWAMRYGRPNIEDGLRALAARGAERVVLFPQYPQYAASTTGTTVAEAYRVAGLGWDVPELVVVPPFWSDAGFAAAFAAVGRAALAEARPGHVLFSFHGLPERQVRRSDPSGAHCLASESCCATISAVNRRCYRAQCHATARALAGAMGLAPGAWSVSFQSRLGRVPWIRPYTDEVVLALRERGVERLAVLCPAFVADCLETLEEIGLRARRSFEEAGGEALTLVPSLNSRPEWVRAAAALVRRTAGAAA